MAEITREQDVTVVELDKAYDALDTAGMQRLDTLLQEEVGTADPPQIVFDMSHTEYIGSRFIELLVRTWKQLRDRNGQMALCGLSPFCRDVIRTTRLEAVWAVHDSRDEAIAALQTG